MRQYSQKYCIVSFLSPSSANQSFNMHYWPPHITIAGVFSHPDNPTSLQTVIESVTKKTKMISLRATLTGKLGEIPVMFVENTDNVVLLHTQIVTALEKSGGVFDTPAYTKDGFIPHVTLSPLVNIHENDRLELQSVSLIDMFPNGDWTQRVTLSKHSLIP